MFPLRIHRFFSDWYVFLWPLLFQNPVASQIPHALSVPLTVLVLFLAFLSLYYVSSSSVSFSLSSPLSLLSLSFLYLSISVSQFLFLFLFPLSFSLLSSCFSLTPSFPVSHRLFFHLDLPYLPRFIASMDSLNSWQRAWNWKWLHSDPDNTLRAWDLAQKKQCRTSPEQSKGLIQMSTDMSPCETWCGKKKTCQRIHATISYLRACHITPPMPTHMLIQLCECMANVSTYVRTCVKHTANNRNVRKYIGKIWLCALGEMLAHVAVHLSKHGKWYAKQMSVLASGNCHYRKHLNRSAEVLPKHMLLK